MQHLTKFIPLGIIDICGELDYIKDQINNTKKLIKWREGRGDNTTEFNKLLEQYKEEYIELELTLLN